MKNDKIIAKYKATIDKRLKKLGDRPRVRYITSGVITVGGSEYNLNIVNTIDGCIKIAKNLILDKNGFVEACTVLGLDSVPTIEGNNIDDYISDVKQRLSVIQWDAERKSLTQAEAKLSALMSEKAKTASEINDIAGDLGL